LVLAIEGCVLAIALWRLLAARRQFTMAPAVQNQRRVSSGA
jgi:hypothetical protein